MTSAPFHHEPSNIRTILGMMFLLIALFGLYWVAEAVLQLWNSPKSVPFVSLFIELLEENQAPIMRSTQGGEIYLPASWPVVVGLFLSIVLISSVGLLIRCFLSSALHLIFPGILAPKGLLASAKERLTGKPKHKP